jgi:2-keto-4-pentenoate hydratase
MAIDVNKAVDDFWAARQRGEYFPEAYADGLTFDDGYRIQLGLARRELERGHPRIGWKAALTSKAMLEAFGLQEPLFGYVLHSFPSGHSLPASLIKPAAEPELCLRLRRPLTGKVTVADAVDAVESVCASFEIVENRGDAARFPALALADNAQQHSVVLGTPIPLGPALRLDEIDARVMLNGNEIARGRSDAVLGNPIHSVVWLAQKLEQFGQSIQAGDIVMTGSVVRQFPIGPGDRAEAHFDGVGAVTFSVAS